MRFMEEKGFYGQVVEHFCTFTNRRKDFLGFADAIFLNPSAKEKTIFVQLTSRSNISSRWHKISDVEVKNKKTEEFEHNKVRDNAKLALSCGNPIWIIGWDSDKMGDRKGKIRKIFLEKDELQFVDEEIVWEKTKNAKDKKVGA